MNKSIRKVFITAVSATVLLFILALAPGQAGKASAAPYVFTNGEINYDNSAEGYVSAKFLSEAKKKLKLCVLYNTNDKNKYNYDLNNKGTVENFPLQYGNGKYTVTVYENISGTKYAVSGKTSFEVKYKSANSPFLAATQYVNFYKDSKVSKLAQDVVTKAKATTDIQKLNAIYKYVVENYTYDTPKAKDSAGLVGYFPNLDKIIEDKKGICFDYASLMAAMLRSQGVPSKLIFGDVPVGQNNAMVYHAWNEVYIEGKGWIEIGKITMAEKAFTRLDPTFASSSKSSNKIVAFIGTGTNYTLKYYF